MKVLVPEFAGTRCWACLSDRIAALIEAAGAVPREMSHAVGVTGLAADFDGEPKPPAAGVLVLPVRGAIVPRGSWLSRALGWTALDGLRAQLRAAVADPGISAIVLDVDSPGGLVEGLAETAELLRALRDVKPIMAISNALCASAAYYMAAQASEVWATVDSMTGSIGTVLVHAEFSKALEAEGIAVTVIRSPEGKFQGNEFEALAPETRARFQEFADNFTAQFVADVAKGRGVTGAKVGKDFGRGDVLLAKEALAAGMVDKIGTLDQVIARAGTRRKGLRAEQPAPAPLAARAGLSPENRRRWFELEAGA